MVKNIVMYVGIHSGYNGDNLYTRRDGTNTSFTKEKSLNKEENPFYYSMKQKP
jgi:hypothetical protein